MALKITKSIGTNLGITNEAYIRISTYNIQKNGNVSFSLELFNSKPEESVNYMNSMQMMNNINLASNIEIGTSLSLNLTKKEKRIRIVKKSIQKEVQVTEIITTPPLIEGEEPTESVITKTETRQVMEDVEESYEIDVPDLTILEDISIFKFAYGKLKEKLQTLFGETNIIDC